MADGPAPIERSLPKERIETVAQRALTNLQALKETQGKDRGTRNNKDTLSNAVSNLDFVRQQVMPIVSEFLTRTGKITTLTGLDPSKNTDSEYFAASGIYCSAKGGPYITFIGPAMPDEPTFGGTLLTNEVLQTLWDQKIERDSIESFAKMSREKLIGKFESTVARAAKSKSDYKGAPFY